MVCTYADELCENIPVLVFLGIGIMEFAPLNEQALRQLFTEAHTAHAFLSRPIAESTVRQLYEMACLGPTAFNAQPARFVFIRTEAGKERLIPALSPGNVPQVQSAPLTVIVAYDLDFHQHLPRVFKGYDAKPIYENAPELAESVAFRNGTLQGAYLLMAARALGLSAGPMSGFDVGKVDQAFFHEGRIRTNFLMNVGYPDPAGMFPRNERLGFAEAVTLA